MSVEASEASSSFAPGRSRSAGAASCQISLYPSEAYSELAAVLAPSTWSEMAGSSHFAAAVSHCAQRRRARPLPRVLGATARLASSPKHLYSGRSSSVSSARLILRYRPRSAPPMTANSWAKSASPCARVSTRLSTMSTIAASTPTQPTIVPALSRATYSFDRSRRWPTSSP
eukprot:scaffold43200_cov69-Phaeocystis_antarctica.AAC.4